MFTAQQYVKAATLEEAYELNQKRNNAILGGGCWMKMNRRRYQTLIDLSGLGLDKIEKTPEEFVLGAMVTLRQLETSPELKEAFGNGFYEMTRHIVGVQFRNCATVGGSLFGRFGFSDVLTLFPALDARVTLHHAGEMPLADFAALPRTTRDILTQVTVPKAPRRVVYLSQRNISTDFPVLTCALGERDGAYTCVIGARPMPAVAFADEKSVLAQGITEESARAFAEDIAARVELGGNMRASEDYRREICKVLVRRAAMALSKEG